MVMSNILKLSTLILQLVRSFIPDGTEKYINNFHYLVKMFPKVLTGYLKYHIQSFKSDIENLEALIFSGFHIGQVIFFLVKLSSVHKKCFQIVQ